FDDNCPMASIAYVLTGATTGTGAGTLDGVDFEKGTTTVTWTVTDMSEIGRASWREGVVNDTQLPTITCPMIQTRSTDLGQCNDSGQGVGFDETFGDNCPMAGIAYELTGATTGTGMTSLAGVDFLKGTTTVTWTVTDMSGNTATCSFTVVVNDTQLPTNTGPAHLGTPIARQTSNS